MFHFLPPQLYPLYPYLSLLQLGFTGWMIYDAYRRNTDGYWFWFILFVQPIGAWVYFFTNKLPEIRAHGWGGFGSVGGLSLFQRRESLDELRYRVQQVPTLASRLALAERLIERHEYTDALPYLESALKTEPEHGQVLFALAVCQRALGKPLDALRALEVVLKRDPRWSDYAAWQLAIAVQTEAGDTVGALERCRALVRQSPAIQHECLLADRLIAAGLHEEADGLLQQALQAHAYSPAYLRRRNGKWARQAKQLLKQIQAE